MSFDPASFANPPAEFRPVPFWSWNDHLDVERLIEQQRSLRRAGMGGFFMHSRPGIYDAVSFGRVVRGHQGVH